MFAVFWPEKIFQDLRRKMFSMIGRLELCRVLDSDILIIKTPPGQVKLSIKLHIVKHNNLE